MRVLVLLVVLVGCATTSPELPAPPEPSKESSVSEESGGVPPFSAKTRSPRFASVSARFLSRPIRRAPKIVRINEHPDFPQLKQDYFCAIRAEEDAIWYEQGGITRPIGKPFPCPSTCEGYYQPTWCDGTRSITVTFNDRSTATIPEVWPQ